MKNLALLVACWIAGGGLLSVAQARPEGIHAETFPCTRCHTKTPRGSDTLEDAPLVLPVQELCASCHETAGR